MMKFIVDKRIGCIAVKIEGFDGNGPYLDDVDVVAYWHGHRNDDGVMTVSDPDIEKAHEICDKLNNSLGLIKELFEEDNKARYHKRECVEKEDATTVISPQSTDTTPDLETVNKFINDKVGRLFKELVSIKQRLTKLENKPADTISALRPIYYGESTITSNTDYDGSGA
jgi:hypothetical protein